MQWCFSQVKGAVDEDVAEGKAAHLGGGGALPPPGRGPREARSPGRRGVRSRGGRGARPPARGRPEGYVRGPRSPGLRRLCWRRVPAPPRAGGRRCVRRGCGRSGGKRGSGRAAGGAGGRAGCGALCGSDGRRSARAAGAALRRATPSELADPACCSPGPRPCGTRGRRVGGSGP